MSPTVTGKILRFATPAYSQHPLEHPSLQYSARAREWRKSVISRTIERAPAARYVILQYVNSFYEMAELVDDELRGYWLELAEDTLDVVDMPLEARIVG